MENHTGGTRADVPGCFGRREEITQLNELIGAGLAQPVVVRGPAGIGKTALIEAALSTKPAGQATVLRTGCRETTGSFGAVRTLFSGGQARSTGPEHIGLSTVQSNQGRPNWGQPNGGQPGRARQTYEVMHELHRLADEEIRRSGGLLIVLDDLQFCDSESLQWIDFQLRRSAGLPLSIVLAYRTGTQMASGVDHLGWGAVLHTVIDLGPLPEEAVVELVTRTFGRAPEPLFTSACTQASGGNPGLLRRILRELKRYGVQPLDSAAARVGDVGRTAVITSALAEAGDGPVREVAIASAVLGEGDPGLVSALTGLPAGIVRPAASSLAQMGLLTEDGTQVRDESVRAAVLDGLPGEQLTDLRTRVARLLSDAGQPARRVADQLLELPNLAEPWMLDTLRDVSQQVSVAHRARYLRPLLAADPTDIPTRLDLARALARSDASTASRLLWETLDMVSDARERAMIASRIALTAPGTTKSAELLDEVLPDLPEADMTDADLLATAEAARLITGISGRETVASTLRRQTPAAPPGDTAAERLLLAALGLAAAARGEPAHVAARYARRALQVDETRFGGTTLFLSAFVLYLADKTTDALAALDRMLETSRTRADIRAECAALSLRALVICQSGDIGEAIADARAAVDIVRQTPSLHESALPRIALAAALTRGHDPARAAVLLDEVDPEQLGTLEYHEYLMTKATVHWALGDSVQSLDILLVCGSSLAAAGITNPVFATWWVDAACLLMELGRATEARAAAEHGRALSARWGTPHSAGLALLAQASTATGAEAVALFGAAAAKLAESAFRLHQLRAEYRLGLALLQIQDTKAARTRLRRVVDLAVGRGHRILAAQARDQLVVSGGRMQPIAGAPADMLTVSERRVATLAASGCNNREIAESLVVTLRTVEIHLTNAYRKLGVTGREDLRPALLRGDMP